MWSLCVASRICLLANYHTYGVLTYVTKTESNRLNCRLRGVCVCGGGGLGFANLSGRTEKEGRKKKNSGHAQFIHGHTGYLFILYV